MTQPKFDEFQDWPLTSGISPDRCPKCGTKINDQLDQIFSNDQINFESEVECPNCNRTLKRRYYFEGFINVDTEEDNTIGDKRAIYN
jgi:hypothetical protein